MELRSATAAKTVEVLRQLFARYGLLEQVVSDNGSQFTSEEFEEFMKRNGIKHMFSAPYHPATNGLVERFVQTFKKAMKDGEKDIHMDVGGFFACFLFVCFFLGGGGSNIN